jgi:hypothetical protein
LIILLLIILYQTKIDIEFYKNKKCDHSYPDIYCFQNNQCVRKKCDLKNPGVCGISTMTNDLNPIYPDLESCKKSNLICDGLSREDCMITSQCGWCTNQYGEGKCIYSNPTGPQNPIIQCYPNVVQDNINSFMQGNAVPFIKDKYEEKDFYLNIL